MGTHPNLFVALTAGLANAFTGCVYPMIPITISVFGAKAGSSRTRALALATCYVAGIMLMYGTAGVIVAKLGERFAFSKYLGDPRFVVPLALFFFAMGLSMFGAFELALPSGLQSRLARVGGRGFRGAFLMGLVAGIIASPCTGPPLAALLAYVGTTRNPVYGFELLAAYGAGIGVPFWVLAGFSMSLPRPGPWMDGVKSVFGIILFTAGLYYLKNVLPALTHFTGRTPVFAAGMAVLVLAGLALGAVHSTFYGRASEKLRKGVGVAMVVIGVFGSINYMLTPKGKIELAWLRDEGAAVAAARSTGQPLLVDFMATWCFPCKEFEVKVFSRPEVAEEMQRFTLLRVDLTNEDADPTLGVLRKRYGADTLPAIRVVSPAGALLGKTDKLMTAEAFLELLRASKSRGGT
jgi:thiol:disulfide interchange protein DsbD